MNLHVVSMSQELTVHYYERRLSEQRKSREWQT